MTTEYQVLLKNLRKYPVETRQNLVVALKNYIDDKRISASTLMSVFYPKQEEITMLEKVEVGFFASSFSRLSPSERARLIRNVGRVTIREKLTRQVNRFIENSLNECFGNIKTRNM